MRTNSKKRIERDTRIWHLWRREKWAIPAIMKELDLSDGTVREVIRSIRDCGGLKAYLRRLEGPQRKIIKAPKKNEAPWYHEGNTVLHDDGKLLKLGMLPEKVVCFSCTQAPLEHKEFLHFMAMVIADERPDLIIMLGDLADMTFAKPKFVHPDEGSPTQEIEAAQAFVQDMARIMPRLICLSSNHLEGRVATMQKAGNIPSIFIKKWQEVIGFPDTWITRDFVILRNWLFEHGHDVSKGTRPSIREEMVRRFRDGNLSVMRAHRHNLFGEVMIPAWATPTLQQRICYVGCGMDETKVFYTRSGLWNGCVVLDRGVPRPIPMERDISNKWTGRLCPW